MKDTILRNDAKEFQIVIETSSEIKKKKKNEEISILNFTRCFNDCPCLVYKLNTPNSY